MYVFLKKNKKLKWGILNETHVFPNTRNGKRKLGEKYSYIKWPRLSRRPKKEKNKHFCQWDAIKNLSFVERREHLFCTKWPTHV